MKVPRRRCVICREVLDKSELLRLVLHAGRVELDREQRRPGRGVYVHSSTDCFNRLSANATLLGRAFRGRVNAEQLIDLK